MLLLPSCLIILLYAIKDSSFAIMCSYLWCYFYYMQLKIVLLLSCVVLCEQFIHEFYFFFLHIIYIISLCGIICIMCD